MLRLLSRLKDEQAFVAQSCRCTYPACGKSFADGSLLARHRFVAHQIRSFNADSMRRQEARDLARHLERQKNAPEEISPRIIRERLDAVYPRAAVRPGPLDPGDREVVRRRLVYLVTTDLARELGRTPAELTVAIAQLAASALESPADRQRREDRKLQELLHA